MITKSIIPQGGCYSSAVCAFDFELLIDEMAMSSSLVFLRRHTIITRFIEDYFLY